MAYITVQNLRDEGVSDPPYSDAWVTGRIALACELFDQATGRFFELRDDYTLQLDGRAHKQIVLPVPPIAADAITSVTVDDEELSSDYYRLVMPDTDGGRLSPRLLRVGGTWPEGVGNVVVVGSFGWIESDGSAPVLVQEAVKRMAIADLPELSKTNANAGAIIEESVTDYSYKLSEKLVGGGLWGDSRINAIIGKYRGLRLGRA